MMLHVGSKIVSGQISYVAILIDKRTPIWDVLFSLCNSGISANYFMFILNYFKQQQVHISFRKGIGKETLIFKFIFSYYGIEEMTFSIKAILRFVNINTILFYITIHYEEEGSMSISSVCMSVLLAPSYGHTPIFIIVRFGILVLGTKAEWRMCKDFFVSHPFQNSGSCVGLFRSYWCWAK